MDPPHTHGTDGTVSKRASRSVADTTSRLIALAEAKGMKVFAVIDQRAEAQRAGLELRDTVLVLIGSPAAGTPVMEAAPLSALDLPLRVLIWDDHGHTTISYLAPAALASRYRLPPHLSQRLAGIDALTDGLVDA